MDILAMWPGRCAICGKLWMGRCYHEAGEPGHYKTEKRQVLPSRALVFWLGVLCGVLWTAAATMVLAVVF